MATVNKDFKIKSGLIVEGTTATVNGYDILTKNPNDDQHIIDLIGGEATSANTPNTVVKRNGDGDFAAGVITADLIGDVTGTVSSLSNHDTADLAENATNKYFTNQRAIDANTGLWDTIGAAATAQSNAEDYADGLAVNYDPAGSAATAQSNAEDYADGLAVNYDAAGSATSAAATALQDAKDYADALDTDDVAEGTAQYFTDARAKSSAADLLTGASLTNITITGTGAGLTITAENGVADSDTDDLAEGSTNLYFTDTRAVNAIDNANITPNQIDINWARTETATWTAIPTASQAVCHQAGGNYGTIKYLVRVVATIAGTRHSHATEVLATVDGSNGVAVVEYGTIYTSAEPMATVTVLWNGVTNCYELNVTTANNNSEVMVAASALATID